MLADERVCFQSVRRSGRKVVATRFGRSCICVALLHGIVVILRVEERYVVVSGIVKKRRRGPELPVINVVIGYGRRERRIGAVEHSLAESGRK